MANGFCNYFSTVASTLKQTSYPLTGFTWRKPLNQPLRTCKSFHFEYLSVTKVTQLLKKIKLKKASGNYDLPPGLLKDSAAVISVPLTHFINLSLRSGVFPSDSKIVNFTFVQNGATDQFGNYRLISILPKISKNRTQSVG